MSENLFSFPGGTTPEETGEMFNGTFFQDLGSGTDEENPFLDMKPDASGAEAAETPEAQPRLDQPAEAAAEAMPPVAPVPPQNAAKPAAAAGKRAKTPPAEPAGEESNPLLAAMDLQEERNARRAAEPIFAQLPVFSYNGNEEPIENINQTFEELRIAKADDFPEFDEGGSVTWTVKYGKVTKNVPTPRKVKIGDLKREIESSKEFMDALKKSADKKPKCIVQPTVRMQKKGVLKGYKGVFANLAEARGSDKTICFIPGCDGKVYERRVNDAGEFITPTSNVTMLDSIRPGFQPALPRIPYSLMEQAVSLFRCLMTAGAGRRPMEALVHFYWDKETERFFLHVPHQKVGRDFVDAVLDDEELLNGDRYIHYADLHSHNNMKAVFSRQDDRDERANRVYMVVGRLDRYYPDLSVRICNGGKFQAIRPDLVLEPVPLAVFPTQWLQNIELTGEPELEAAA